MEDILNKNLMSLASVNKVNYQQAEPFPNIYFKEFFNISFLDKVLSEFPDLSKGDSVEFDNLKEKKFAAKGEARFGAVTKKMMYFLNSQPFLDFLQELTGIEEVLLGDPYYIGGGLHEIKKNGLLKIHADFNKHYTTNLDRRVNVLIYLNKDWEESFGGDFELWNSDMTQCVKKVPPLFNTLAIFSTTSISYHGHPNPLNCPEDRSRKSIALYYYTNGRPKSEQSINETHDTLFKERKNLDFFEEKKQKSKKRINLKLIVKELIPPIILKLYGKIR